MLKKIRSPFGISVFLAASMAGYSMLSLSHMDTGGLPGGIFGWATLFSFIAFILAGAIVMPFSKIVGPQKGIVVLGLGGVLSFLFWLFAFWCICITLYHVFNKEKKSQGQSQTLTGKKRTNE